MGKTTACLVLFLLVVATFMNGYNAEGVARGNQQTKNDGIYKSQKFGQCIDCLILYNLCLVDPYLWPVCHKLCPSNDTTSSNIAPNSNETPQPESDLP